LLKEPKEEPLDDFPSMQPGNEVTPQCVLCEVHPKTPGGYTTHLKRFHKTTLLANGIYLTCSCGMRFNNAYDPMKHDKKCTGRQFTLHKLDEMTTPQYFLCEKYPKTTYGYLEHLRRPHKTTLKKNGIYLICACGLLYTTYDDCRKHDKKIHLRIFLFISQTLFPCK
ncbi:hypothetical protein PMAYCL1PPCAC_14298, partial [Pristionchus mayeri]